MAKILNAFIVRETEKHYVVSPVAEYMSITDMLQKGKVIPVSNFLKINKKLVQSKRVTLPCISANGFLTVRENGGNAVETVIGCELVLA